MAVLIPQTGDDYVRYHADQIFHDPYKLLPLLKRTKTDGNVSPSILIVVVFLT